MGLGKKYNLLPAFNLIFLAFLLPACLPFFVHAQPYYAAMKGITCVACHANPAGGGARKIRDASPVFINDAVAVGADLRGSYSNDNDHLNDFSFKTLEQRFYLVAEPVQGIGFVYSNESGATAEAYAIIKKEEWFDVYARFGRFFVPYGLRISDADNSAFIKTQPFAPKNSGFSLQPGVTDTGIEVGLAPKKDYFLNLSVTNGPNTPGSGSAKAVTGRAGMIWPHASLGITGFQNAVPSISDNEQVRYSGFAGSNLVLWCFLLK